MRPIEFTLDGLKLVSEANRASHEHWRSRQKRAKAQRHTARVYTMAAFGGQNVTLPLRVTITRVSPRSLDGDNLQSSAKAVRDGVADAMSIKDNNQGVDWLVTHERGRATVRIRIETVSRFNWYIDGVLVAENAESIKLPGTPGAFMLRTELVK